MNRPPEEPTPPAGAEDGEARPRRLVLWCLAPLSLALLTVFMPSLRGFRGNLETPLDARWPLPVYAATLLILLGLGISAPAPEPPRAGRVLVQLGLAASLLSGAGLALVGSPVLIEGAKRALIPPALAVLLGSAWAFDRGRRRRDGRPSRSSCSAMPSRRYRSASLSSGRTRSRMGSRSEGRST
jgi:hypothetical protein